MKILITGASGFVGPHVIAALKQSISASIDLHATGLKAAPGCTGVAVEKLDVTNRAAVDETIARLHPSHVIHLAGLASVPAASRDPELAWQIHVFGTLNIARALLQHAPEATLLFAGSGQVYGASAASGHLLDEDTVLAPINDYAVTKAAADLALGALAGRGLRAVRLRPFNHTGRAQTEDFVVPSFAMQIAQIEAGLREPVIHVGNLSPERDFLDVRDVAKVYALVVAKSRSLPPGVILNIASGTPVSIGGILTQLLAHSRRAIEVRPDPARMRSDDIPCYIGNAQRARSLLGWTPQYRLEDTILEILDACRLKVAATAARPG